MTGVESPPEEVDRLIDVGDLESARALLANVAVGDERFAVTRIRLSLVDGSMPAGMAQQALIRLMRQDANWPGAKELYREASAAALRGGESAPSHSHPPPPPPPPERKP